MRISIFVGFAILLAGCASSDNRVETHLKREAEALNSLEDFARTKLQDPEARGILARIEKLRDVMREKADLLREQEKAISQLSLEIKALRTELERIAPPPPADLAKVELYFFTAVRDWDGDKCPDGIEAAIRPADAAGDTVKSPGSCNFALYRTSFIGFGETGRKIMEWNFGSNEVAASWLDSTFSGYYFRLRWIGERPIYPKTILRMTFRDTRGRTFTADKELKLELEK